MAHLVSKTKLVNSCCGIAAADDGCSLSLSQSLSDSLCALSKDRVLENAHRSVPDNCLSSSNCLSIELFGLGTDIHAHLVSGDRCDVNDLCCDGRIIDRIREVVSDDCIDREQELLAKALSLLDHLFAVVKLCIIAEGCADLIALCLCECVSHTAADDECVALLKEIGNNVELISNLCTAEDSNERTNRILNSLAEELNLFLHQVANYAGAALSADIFCHDSDGSVCSVSGTESIADIVVAELSKLFCELLASLAGLGLFLASETGVLKEDDIAFVHSCNSCCCISAGYVVISDEFDFLAELLGKSCCNGSKRLTLVGAVLNFAEVGAKDDLAAIVDELLDRRQCSHDTGLICDNAALKRNVEIASDKNSLALYVDIINGLFV